MSKRIYGLKSWTEKELKELKKFRTMLGICLDESQYLRKKIRQIANSTQGRKSLDKRKMEYYNKK